MSSKNTNGFLPLYREVCDDPIFTSGNDRMFKLWIYLGLSAAYQEADIEINKTKVHLKRGEFACTYREIAKIMKWNEITVRRSIKYLKNENKILVDSNNLYTKITILNYENFGTNNSVAPKTQNLASNFSISQKKCRTPVAPIVAPTTKNIVAPKTDDCVAPNIDDCVAPNIDYFSLEKADNSEKCVAPKIDDCVAPKIDDSVALKIDDCVARSVAPINISINNKYIKNDDKSVPCIKKLASDLFKNKSDKSLSSSFLNCLKEFRASNSDLFDNPDLLYEQKELLPQFVAIYTLNKSYGTQIKNFGSYSHCTIEQFEAGKSEPQGFIDAAINLQEKLIEQEELMQYENPEVDISAKKPKRATKDIIASLHPKNKKRPPGRSQDNQK